MGGEESIRREWKGKDWNCLWI